MADSKEKLFSTSSRFYGTVDGKDYSRLERR